MMLILLPKDPDSVRAMLQRRYRLRFRMILIQSANMEVYILLPVLSNKRTKYIDLLYMRSNHMEEFHMLERLFWDSSSLYVHSTIEH